MSQKMFKCGKCGLIPEIVAYADHASYNIYISYDNNGKEIEEYDNHDADEVSGWYCPNCGRDVDQNDIVEVDMNET